MTGSGQPMAYGPPQPHVSNAQQRIEPIGISTQLRTGGS